MSSALEPDPSSSSPRTCAVCGVHLLRGPLAAQCPRCLLQLGSSLGLPTDEELAAADLLDPLQVRTFGDYELVEEIARGGMGVVYRGWQVSGEREVAVKMILDGQLATPQAVARFRQEAAVAGKLDHPNIVPVYEVGEIDAQHFFAMRFIAGKRNVASWARALPPEGRLQAIVRMMAQVARTIGFAHARGVLHRDLKPSNILIDEHDQPQVTDFGLAKLIDDPDAAALTLSTAILGSPSYMAPEQAEPRGRLVSAATDVYGLGAILYELLSGRPPFTGDNPLSVVRQVVEAAPRRLLEVPEPLDTICRQCLAKAPSQRYPTAIALAEDLERFASGRAILAERESTLAQLATWSRRHPAVASLLLALLVTFLVGFGTTFWQWRRTQAANDGLRRSLFHLEWRQLDVLLERDFAGRALAELARRLRADPSSWQSATYALSILEQRPFAFPAAAPLAIAPEWLAAPPALAVDSQRAAFVHRDGRVRLVDTARGLDVAPPLALGAVAALAFSPDGTRLAVGERGGSLVLCDAGSGQIISRTATDAAPLRAVAFSGDGQTLAFAGGTLVGSSPLTTFVAGETPTRLLPAPFAATELRTSQDGRTLLAWNSRQAGALGIFDAAAAAPFTPDSARRARAASLDAEGRHVAFVSDGYEVEVWDLAERMRRCVIAATGPSVNQVALTPDGQFVVVATIDGAVRTCSATTGQPVFAPLGHRYQLESSTLTPDGTRLLTSSRDASARLWDIPSGRPLVEPVLHEGHVEHVALDRRGARGLVLTDDSSGGGHVLHSWFFPTLPQPRTFCPEGGRDHEASRLSPDERFLAVGTSVPKPSLTVFEVATGRPVLDRTPVPGSVYCCEFTPDGQRLLVATNNGWVYGWHVPSTGDPTHWTPLFPPVKAPSGLQPATLSPDGEILALGCLDGILRLHDARTGRLLREMRHGALLKSVRFSHDGTRVATGGMDALIHLWSVASGEKLVTFRGHTAGALGARFSRDDTRLLSYSYDSTARFWDTASGAALIPPLVHRGDVSTADLSPDGRLIGTGSLDGTARVWDAATGRPLSPSLNHPAIVAHFIFHPDGRRFLTADLGAFRLWDAATFEPITGRYEQRQFSFAGLDSPSVRDILSPLGGHLMASNSMDHAVYRPLLDPPVPVPAWFPEFLEDLADGGLFRAEGHRSPDRQRLFRWKARVEQFRGRDFYEAWVSRYLRSCGVLPPSDRDAAPPAPR